MKDERVIQGILKKEETMMAYVIHKYSRLLWSVVQPVLTNVASDQDVEECVADVFIFLWERPESYKPDKAKLSSYLTIVARTKAIDRYRKICRKQEVPLEEEMIEKWSEDSVSQPLKLLLEQEQRQKINALLDLLGEPMREILVRRYFYNQKPREISMAMDMPIKQVENSLYGAKRRLRQMLEEGKAIS
ncbi:MAG: sigma-70 family RNA polymerase sigma factor [Lachnospiraceae bacterium]|nr:sigma-70 family RNA polymerase sigma factor [Lachnospiraceae bacterium]